MKRKLLASMMFLTVLLAGCVVFRKVERTCFEIENIVAVETGNSFRMQTSHIVVGGGESSYLSNKEYALYLTYPDLYIMCNEREASSFYRLTER